MIADLPPTTAIRDALDQAAADIASAQGWTYADRLDTHGDYRRLRATLVFIADETARECDRDGTHCKPVSVRFEWEVDARAVRCSRGRYAVESALTDDTCPGTVTTMSWTWPAAHRWTP